MLSPTGSAGARHGTVLDDGRVMVTGASEHRYELDRACHACAEAMASAMAHAKPPSEQRTSLADLYHMCPVVVAIKANTSIPYWTLLEPIGLH